MRFISLAAVLSAALLPAANARPACRPDRSTTSGEPATTAATTTATIVETSSADTATTLDASTTYETTSALETTIVGSATDETTTALKTTITISAPATSDSTAPILTTIVETIPAEIPTTTAAITSVEIATTTTEAATTTTTEAAGPTAFVKNGGFEDTPNTVWDLSGSTIKNSPGLAHTGSQYVEFAVNNNYATGQNVAVQYISGLSTARQYRLSFYANVFSTPTPVLNSATLCFMQASQGNNQITLSKLDFTNLDTYQLYSVNFTPVFTEFQLKLALRCTNGQLVTLAVGVDDVSITEVV